MGESSTRWLSIRWAGSISAQWCVPTADTKAQAHTNGETLPNVIQRGGAGPCWAPPAKRFAARRQTFHSAQGISVSPKRDGGTSKSCPYCYLLDYLCTEGPQGPSVPSVPGPRLPCTGLPRSTRTCSMSMSHDVLLSTYGSYSMVCMTCIVRYRRDMNLAT